MVTSLGPDRSTGHSSVVVFLFLFILAATEESAFCPQGFLFFYCLSRNALLPPAALAWFGQLPTSPPSNLFWGALFLFFLKKNEKNREEKGLLFLFFFKKMKKTGRGFLSSNTPFLTFLVIVSDPLSIAFLIIFT